MGQCLTIHPVDDGRLVAAYGAVEDELRQSLVGDLDVGESAGDGHGKSPWASWLV
jgi:hypothetical protein